MKKDAVIEEIHDRVAKMQWLLTICGVKLPLPEDLTKVKHKHLVAGNSWLTVVWDDCYIQTARVRRSVPEEVWARYAASDITDLHEIQEWAKQSVLFRKAIRSQTRPLLFVKNKHSKLLMGAKEANEAN